MNKFPGNYWAQRWQKGETGWDIGSASSPFLPYFTQLKDKHMRILIPGCGNAYEAEHLWKAGFTEVYVADIVQAPLDNFKKRNPDFPSDHLLCTDFFLLNDRFDLILEQTFYCALDPSLRNDYVKQMHALLKPGGVLAGVLFNFPLSEEGPPFGGSEEEYRKRFSPYFEIGKMEACKTSIAPRAGREIWIELVRKPDQSTE